MSATPIRTRPPAAPLGVTAALLAVLAIVLAGCWLLYRLEANRISAQHADREAVRVSLLSQLMRSELVPVTDDLRFLADGDGLHSYLRTGQPEALQAAIRRARNFSVQKPIYDELRFIDQNGQEIIRVRRGGEVIAGAQLENKADRRYFQQANRLTPGSLYVSAFELTLENDSVQRPLKPVLRMAVPVFDSRGERRGIYLINYLGADLISRLQRAAAGLDHRLRLLNASGYWLKAADPEQEWGFVLPGRETFNLARSDPLLWSQVRQLPQGQREMDGGLFTWQRLPPTDFTRNVEGQLIADDAFLILGSEVSRTEWAALFAGLRQTMIIVATGLVLLTLLSAMLFQGRRRILLQLRATNLQLEQRVSERTAELARSLEMLTYREHLLEETGSLAKVGGWDFDPLSGKGRWTAEVARIHDLREALEPSKDFGLQFYPGKSRERLEAALQKSLADGSPYDLELEFVAANGEHKWVRTIARPIMQDGKVVRMRGALQDVTERKLSEIRLSEQLQRMQLLERTTRAIGERQDLASILQVVIRTLEEQLPLDFGCVCLYDPSTRNLTVAAVGVASVALAEQLSMPERARIPIDENGLSRCVAGQLVYEDDISQVQFPFPQRLAAGGLRSLVAAPLQIESQVFGVLVAARRAPDAFSSGDCEFLRQLSEHVGLAAHQAQLHGALQAAYEDLRATQQAVMQQERLRVLGQMASGIAHDINNAISPIMLYTESLLERESELSEPVRSNLRIIQQAVSDVAETVARMREFYRQRDAHGDLQTVELNKLVSQTRELTRARWETIPQQHGVVVDIALELHEPLPLIQGIESEIREAVTNLVFNAVDAMPSGGRLTLRTRPGPAGRVLIEVGDTGMGMSEETMRRCLEPFFTTKGERGTGLGLAMVYGVMQRHGGEVEIDSAPGVGTTVRLSFVEAEAPVAAKPEETVAIPTGLTLLLVDDDPVLLNSLREILELDGHQVRTANGGQAGIESFRASLAEGDRFIAAVITDLGMPHVDGRTVARAVKQASPETPVIMLTGWGERLLAEGHTPPHVDRVLSKPPRLRELRRALAELTRRPAQGAIRGPIG
jgi:signal transduction histidine kinase/ActR/RegA family two-component response regulator/PAS domain-containing protein